jgi:hypothetical protein
VKVSNVDRPGPHSDGIVRGQTGRRAAAIGVRWTDSAGNDFGPSPDVEVIGADLSETDEGVRLSFSGSVQGFPSDNGSVVDIGEVIIIQTDGTIADTTTPQDTRPVGIVQRSTDDGFIAPVLFAGYVLQVNTTGTVNEGDYLETSASAGLAQANASRRTGSFAVALGDGPNPPALMFGIPDSSDSAVVSGDGLVPYYIPVGETFTVPLYRQALFSEAIENDGALIVNGLLLGVD